MEIEEIEAMEEIQREEEEERIEKLKIESLNEAYYNMLKEIHVTEEKITCLKMDLISAKDLLEKYEIKIEILRKAMENMDEYNGMPGIKVNYFKGSMPRYVKSS